MLGIFQQICVTHKKRRLSNATVTCITIMGFLDKKRSRNGQRNGGNCHGNTSGNEQKFHVGRGREVSKLADLF